MSFKITLPITHLHCWAVFKFSSICSAFELPARGRTPSTGEKKESGCFPSKWTSSREAVHREGLEPSTDAVLIRHVDQVIVGLLETGAIA